MPPAEHPGQLLFVGFPGYDVPRDLAELVREGRVRELAVGNMMMAGLRGICARLPVAGPGLGLPSLVPGPGWG